MERCEIGITVYGYPYYIDQTRNNGQDIYDDQRARKLSLRIIKMEKYTLTNDTLIKMLDKRIDLLNIETLKELLELCRDKIESQESSIKSKIDENLLLKDVIYILMESLDLKLDNTLASNKVWFLRSKTKTKRLSKNQYEKLENVFSKLEMIKDIMKKGNE